MTRVILIVNSSDGDNDVFSYFIADKGSSSSDSPSDENLFEWMPLLEGLCTMMVQFLSDDCCVMINGGKLGVMMCLGRP
jgi:hypothetical protein